MRTFARTEPGERIDEPDFHEVAETSLREMASELGDGFLVGPDADTAQPRNFVLKGFAVTNPSGQRITVAGGSMLVGTREDGQTSFGELMTGGPASRTRDLASIPNATYFVYVRLQYEQADFQNRLTWNADAVTPVEIPRSIPTRRIASWQMAVEQVSPGPEWMRVARVFKAAPAAPDLTDLREFFFEGQSDADFVPSEWGDAPNDRSNDRDLHGLFGVRRFVRATQRLLADITGTPNGWWWRELWGSADGSDGARSLAQLNAEKLARNGAQKMTGDLLPDADDSRDVGSNSFRWKNIRAVTLRAVDVLFGGELIGVDATLTGDLSVSNDAVIGGDVVVGGNNVILRQGAVADATAVNKLDFNTAATDDKHWATVRNVPDGGAGGSARVEVQAGNSAEGTVHLRGATGKIAEFCEGEKGLGYGATGDIALATNAIAAGGVLVVTVTPATMPFGCVLNDAIIHWWPSIHIDEVTVDQMRVRNASQIDVIFRNTNDTLQRPVADKTISFTFVVLRKP